jgi:hypothetical protein
MKKKAESKHEILLDNVIYEDLTLEDLKKAKPIKDNLVHVLIEFKNRNIRYESLLFPKDTEGHSIMYLDQTDPTKEGEGYFKAVIGILRDHYPGLQTRSLGKYDSWLIMPNHIVLDMETIIGEIQDFFVSVFEDVKIRQLRFENVRKADLSRIRVSEAKLVLLKNK